MDKVLGIICEYNPFHVGHSYHIAASELLMGEHAPVVCVMSGDFVQRGEPAVFPKHKRAEAAVRSGADLVVELPVNWCLSSAEYFARGGVSILGALGVTHLSFGSESGDIAALKSLAEQMKGEAFDERLKAYIKANPEKPYASAVAETACSDILGSPNNLLGVEYIRAIEALCPSMEPITVKRYTHHDGADSAMAIREKIYSGEISAEHIDREKFQIAALSRLRMFDKEYYNSLPNAHGGLGARVYEAVRRGGTLDEIYSFAKTKRFSLSAVRRLVMCAALGLEEGVYLSAPPYIRVLAFNEKGREHLASAASKSSIPVITRPKEIYALGENAQKVFAAGAYAKDLYQLAMPYFDGNSCGNDYRTGPVIVKN